MPRPQIKLKHPPASYDAWDSIEADATNTMAGGRVEPGCTQIDFDTPADAAAEYWYAIRVLAAVAIAAIGALAALVYFAGALAAGIAVMVVAILVAFGIWVLNNTADLF